MYTEAGNKATQRYVKKHYDRIEIKVPKGDKEKYTAAAQAFNLSMNQFVISAMQEKMERLPEDPKKES